MFLTVITPSYNRAHLLPRLYDSLVKQRDPDFEWIVVDDGSEDETEGLISGFIEEKKIPIIYKKIKHSGKPSAHNEGVLLARGELTACVDSDDMLTEDAVTAVKHAWSGCDSGDIGIIAPRASISGERLCSALTSGDAVSFDTLYSERGFLGDTALFFKTEVLKGSLFPSFTGEAFIPEDALYFALDKVGTLRVMNQEIYICEYLPDGLSANYLSLLRKNPMGTAYSYFVKASHSKRLKYRIKYAIISESYLKLSARAAEYDRKYPWWLLFTARLLCPLYMRKKGLR